LRAGKPITPIFSIHAAAAAIAITAGLLLAHPALAQVSPDALRLAPGQAAPTLPADGTYLAGDYRFAIDRSGDYERLHFTGDDEIYYLTVEPGAMGGRVLKYDTGEVALQVAGWSGVTLYTRKVPGGLPAERTGYAVGLDAPPLIPGDQIKTFAVHISDEIQSRTGLVIGFRANWDAFTRSDPMRALACEAMRNAARAIERIASQRKEAQALIAQFTVVRIAPANTPGVSIGDNLLTITFTPALGAAGRPSSLAIVKTIREHI
jgi:Domain of unknown function (DUF4908)